jgi:hypothetical protein
MSMTAWSFTALKQFETCPRQYYEQRIAKSVPYVQSDAAAWGDRVHQALEARLKAQSPLPDLLKTYEPLAETIEARAQSLGASIHCEQKVAITHDFIVTDWFAPDVWLRGAFDVVLDAGEKLVLLDWKTGKRRPEQDQLKLFSVLASIVYPAARVFHTGFVWLKTQQLDVTTYKMDDLRDIWTNYIGRAGRLDQAVKHNEFPPKPSGLCRGWCPVKTCQYFGG